MLYLIIDLKTGETVDKARTAEKAEQKASWLDDLHSWTDGHMYGYILAPITA